MTKTGVVTDAFHKDEEWVLEPGIYFIFLLASRTGVCRISSMAVVTCSV